MMSVVSMVPFVLQAALMAIDEGVYHRRRGLPRWERIGHPIDTISVVVCFAWLVAVSPRAPHAVAIYISLASISCICITKDEFVHKALCDVKESWLHAMLFVLHPTVLFVAATLWISGRLTWLLCAQLVLTSTFAIYQTFYWKPWKPTPK